MIHDRKFKCGDTTWPCFSKRKMRQKYPNTSYKIIGEITHKSHKASKTEVTKDRKTLQLSPPGTYSSFLYRPYAYIEMEDDCYIEAKKSNLPYIFLLVIIFISLIFGLFYKINSGPPLDPDAQDYQAALKRPADWDSDSILIPGFDDLRMIADGDMIYVVFNNPDENPCYFQYTIVLNETEETLYESGLIAPGKAVKSVQLSKRLKEGIYPVTIRINTYSLEDYEQQLNGGVVKTNIRAIVQ